MAPRPTLVEPNGTGKTDLENPNSNTASTVSHYVVFCPRHDDRVQRSHHRNHKQHHEHHLPILVIFHLHPSREWVNDGGRNCVAIHAHPNVNTRKNDREKKDNDHSFSHVPVHKALTCPWPPSLVDKDMTMTHSEKSNICQMKAWPYRQECRGYDPTKKICCVVETCSIGKVSTYTLLRTVCSASSVEMNSEYRKKT